MPAYSLYQDGMDRLRQGDIKAAFEQFKSQGSSPCIFAFSVLIMVWQVLGNSSAVFLRVLHQSSVVLALSENLRVLFIVLVAWHA